MMDLIVETDLGHDPDDFFADRVERAGDVRLHLLSLRDPADEHPQITRRAEVSLELARERGLKVIEDCAQATGATYKGRPVGSLGDIGAFSFCQDKIITTGGDGGMLTLNDDALREKAWAFKDHGKSYEAVYRRQHAPGFRWLHESWGTNWRITEMQSAIGRYSMPC